MDMWDERENAYAEAQQTIRDIDAGNAAYARYRQKEYQEKKDKESKAAHNEKLLVAIKRLVQAWENDEGPYSEPAHCMWEIRLLVSGSAALEDE